MNVSLTPELENFVNEKVKSGLYNSASEVLRESLRLLKERDMLKEIQRSELRREIMLGIEQIKNGEYKEYSVDELDKLGEEIIKRGEERREKRKLGQS
ncbi:MAG: type II toxin-antitoxin system ParD family antitoxin [Pyrinomonadaceae bacterium]|jgi:antitoxin ParD1/3/4|nr:type II toxin-antitoxin system ParD family antitoxin [Pyrinomonadaceae bacterium]